MAQTAHLLQTAIAHHRANRFDDAEKAYRTFLHSGSNNPDGLRLLGALYLQTKKYAQAILMLEKVVQLRPNDPEILTNLGIALRGVNQPDDALMRFEQALTLAPDYLPALHNAANLYVTQKRLNDAARIFAHLVNLFPQQAPLHVDYANCLFTQGRVDDAIAHYEKALALDPNNSPAMVNLGMALSHNGNKEASQPWLRRAEGLLKKALQTSPDNPVILNNLGNVLRQQGKADDAAACFRRALNTRPDYAAALINLGTTLRDLNRIDEAIDSCQTALALTPGSAEARINLGTFLQQKGQHQDALTLFSEAIDLNPASIDAVWNKSLSLLALGHYKEGWALHERGLGIPHMRGAYTPAKRWKGEPLVGKCLLLVSEQGFGDTLQFIRYAKKLKKLGAVVHVLCPAPLRQLFANCPFVDALPNAMVDATFDYHIPMMSLPFAFDTKIETIPTQTPYLYVSDKTRARWASHVTKDRTLKVGLVWAGNPRKKNVAAHLVDTRRSIPWDTMAELLKTKNTTFYSLQKDGERPAPNAPIIDDMDAVRNFEDTAAIIENLDLVITVDTAVAHLAGGMNKPVWILSRADACWRWLQNKPKNPWYPSARIFGQAQAGDWQALVETVGLALKKLSEDNQNKR